MKTGMSGCRPANTPIDMSVKLGEVKDDTPVDKRRFQRLVGKLIYMSHTRPNITFVVSKVSQFMHSPYKKYLETIYRILSYLKSYQVKGLLFKKCEEKGIEAYMDTDWARTVDIRSTSGYCTFLWGNLVTWKSKKRSVIARSSAETQFRALTNGICGKYSYEGFAKTTVRDSNQQLGHDRHLCTNLSGVLINQEEITARISYLVID